MAKIERAILSCYDKTGIVELAGVLREFHVEIISTAGTLRVLREAGVDAVGISDFTGVAELLDGRVKSLHPRVHAGLLGIRDKKLHQEQMQALDYHWIDFVAVNLHPLDRFIEQPSLTVEEVVEQIDIGGTAMIRSAAKNFRYVTVVVNPARYKTIIHEMHAHEGQVSFPTRFRLAQEAFACTAAYDEMMADYLRSTQPPRE
jgi:phosphoribosylaminoimidazolecarboxamide formyltransferase/IMP cyclohydrolase